MIIIRIFGNDFKYTVFADTYQHKKARYVLIRRPVIELPDDPVRLEHIHEGLRIYLLDDICDTPRFRTRDYRIYDITFTVRI